MVLGVRSFENLADAGGSYRVLGESSERERFKMISARQGEDDVSSPPEVCTRDLPDHGF